MEYIILSIYGVCIGVVIFFLMVVLEKVRILKQRVDKMALDMQPKQVQVSPVKTLDGHFKWGERD